MSRRGAHTTPNASFRSLSTLDPMKKYTMHAVRVIAAKQQSIDIIFWLDIRDVTRVGYCCFREVLSILNLVERASATLMRFAM